MFTREGNLLRRIASRLIARESVFRALQGVLRASQHARKAMDRNVSRIFSGLNVASHEDIVRLHREVRELETEVAWLAERLHRLVMRRRTATEGNGPSGTGPD